MRLEKIRLLLLGSIIVAATWSCASKNAYDSSASEQNYYALNQTINLGTGDVPEWTSAEGGIIEHESEKYAWIKGEGSSKNKAIAKKVATANAQRRVAQSLKFVIASQFAQAWESLENDNDKESVEKVTQGLTATKTKASITGFKMIQSYNTQTGKVKELSSYGKPKSFKSVRWKYIVMMAMPYSLYIRHRDNALNGVSKTTRPNSRQRKLINKVEKQLKKLDEDPSELFVDTEK